MKHDSLRTIAGVSALLLSVQVMADVTFYEGEGFRGRAFTTSRNVQDFQSSGFNDRASSVVVDRGQWEVCEDARFNGRCVVLRPGSYDTLRRMGVNDRISSVRQVRGRLSGQEAMPEPLSAPDYDYRRRPNERVYEVPVTSVRAVLGRPEQNCWIEREQYEQQRGDRNVLGAVVGGLIGGVLGHQIGGGRGKDLATAGGAVGGAVIGSNVGRGSSQSGRDVRRCETVENGEADYWDVEYRFRNVDHRIQMSAPPGRTVLVNKKGEPRQ